jgi:hypothetical protein
MPETRFDNSETGLEKTHFFTTWWEAISDREFVDPIVKAPDSDS